MTTLEPLPTLLEFAGELAQAERGGPLALLRASGGRALIHGARPEALGLDDLLAWLGARPEVLKVEHRPRVAAIEVEYRELAVGEAAGGDAFVRSLRDRLFSLTPTESPSRHIDLAHALDGRARLRCHGWTDDGLVRLATFLAEQPGVVRARASLASQSVLVSFDGSVTTAEAVLSVARVGPPEDFAVNAPPVRKTPWGSAAFNGLVLGASLTGFVPLPALAAAVGVTAIPSARRAWQAAHEHRLSVDVLDLAAVGISLGTGQAGTAAFITFLLGVGDVILAQTQDRARTAISKLMKLDADDAYRVTVDAVTGREDIAKVSAKKLAVGDRIIVEAGGRVAADGVIVRGVAALDEKALTGESVPRERRQGDKVLAATVVVEGQIVIEVGRIGRDTTAAKIVQILEGAGAKPMTLQRDTERIGDRLVLPTIGLAGGAALLAGQVDRMTSVLITDFGTGIRIAVPTSALAAMTVAARQGVLVKGAQYLERLAKADAIVFDKTGTLTGGSPEVFEVVVVGQVSKDEALAFAAAAEGRQAHPIAEAIREHAKKLGLAVPDADFGSESYAIGLGLAATVRGRHVLVGGTRLMKKHAVDLTRGEGSARRQRDAGASSIYVAVDGELAVVIGYRDEPRPESADVVRALKAGGRRTIVLMSGDARAPVDAVAKAVGVDLAYAELLPEDKATRIRELQKQGKTVAMVGDGINDAPALAVADVGISLHGGTDVALETADVVLLEAGLAKLPDAFAVADDAMRRVRRGLGYVIVPNAIAIVLGAAGLLAPGGAALINNGSTVVAALAAVAPMLGKRRR